MFCKGRSEAPETLEPMCVLEHFGESKLPKLEHKPLVPKNETTNLPWPLNPPPFSAGVAPKSQNPKTSRQCLRGAMPLAAPTVAVDMQEPKVEL